MDNYSKFSHKSSRNSVKIRDKKIREKKIHLERKKEIKIKQVLKLKKKEVKHKLEKNGEMMNWQANMAVNIKIEIRNKNMEFINTIFTNWYILVYIQSIIDKYYKY